MRSNWAVSPGARDGITLQVGGKKPLPVHHRAGNLSAAAGAGPWWGSRCGDRRPWHCSLLLLHGRSQQQTPPGCVCTVGASQFSVFCSSWSANSTGFLSTWSRHRPTASSAQWHTQQTIPLVCGMARTPPWRERTTADTSRAHFPAAGPAQACCCKRQTGSFP